MRVFVKTYGCALNKADTSLMIALLRKDGHEIVESEDAADVILVNTCAVRLDTEQRVIKYLRRIYRDYVLSRGVKLVIAGCMASAQPYMLSKLFPKASLVSPQMVTAVTHAVEGGDRVILLGGERDVSMLPLHINGATAIIPIAEGCLGNCSFCITKVARRKLRSYPPSIVIAKVREAVQQGAVEVDLTAQDTASYGLDLSTGVRLDDLVRAILDKVDGNYMLRIGMANPDTLIPILDGIVEVLKDPRTYKYLHIPMQSADDRVLRIMRRKYTYDEFRSLVREVRSKIPEISIATDIIVGHPGEDEQAFQRTLNAIRELLFDKVHLAQYTLRPRTEAAAMRQIPDPIKKRRSTEAATVIEEVGKLVNSTYVGSIAKVVVTHISFRGSAVARLPNYKPVVLSNVGKEALGRQALARIEASTFYDLRGSIINYD